MRSWEATGNDLLNAIDIKEGMEYAGGIKNTKIAVAEIVPDQGGYFFIYDKFYIFLIHAYSRSYSQNKRTKCINTSLYTLYPRPYESV